MTTRTRPIRFLVDSTVVRLSRWLRFLGLDASLDTTESITQLLVRARREDRVLLTRRRGLEGSEVAQTVLLRSDHLDEQLRQVLSTFGLGAEPSSRCTVCNEELAIVPRAKADGRVPEFIYRSQSEFAFCPACDRYYWRGSHWQNVQSASRDLCDGKVESGENGVNSSESDNGT